MKIACLSDVHGILPHIPDCDLLILAGDYSHIHKVNKVHQPRWFKEKFKPWIDYCCSKTKVVGIAGNHDFIFQDYKNQIPDLKWTYLQDSSTTFEGLNIWGSPWQLTFYNWAFNATEKELKEKYDLIPENTDIIISHGPPYGYGDLSTSGTSVGSTSFLAKIKEIKPKLVVYGHIHEGFGRYQLDDTILVNASHFAWQQINPIQIVEI